MRVHDGRGVDLAHLIQFQVSQPQVIFREVNGQPCEPFEYLVLDVPEEAVGSCIERLGQRKGEM